MFKDEKQSFVLSSGKLEVLYIKKRTKAKFFKDLVEGDEIEVTLKLRGPTYGHSVYVTATNLKTGVEDKSHTVGMVSNYLECFEFKEV